VQHYRDGTSWCLELQRQCTNDCPVEHSFPPNQPALVLARFDPPASLTLWTGCAPGEPTLHRVGDQIANEQYRELRVLTFLSPEELSRQQLTALPRSWASRDGRQVFSGLLPTGEAVTYVTQRDVGRVHQVRVATSRYDILGERRVAKTEPCTFDGCPGTSFER
jgi:hypothetical protein